MRRAVQALICAVLAGVLLSSCGGESPPGAESGIYAGRSGGVGAVVDFRASDPVAVRLRRMLGSNPHVLVVSLVNHSNAPIRVPAFEAEVFDGRLIPLLPMDRNERIAAVGLRTPRALGADTATTVYLLSPEPADAIVEIVMRLPDREIRLTPRERA